MAIKKTRISIQSKKGFDLDSFDSFEVSPDLYTHLVIMEALKAIPKGLEANNFDNGFVALIVTVDQLEQILRARSLLKEGDDYYKNVGQKEKALKDAGVKEVIMFNARMANFKLGELMRLAFSSAGQEGELLL